jgi:hypothetical protein
MKSPTAEGARVTRAGRTTVGTDPRNPGLPSLSALLSSNHRKKRQQKIP